MNANTSAIDPQVLNKLRELQGENEPDIVQEFIELYLSKTPALLTKLREAVICCNLKDFHYLSHTIKGSSSLIGASTMTAISARLEDYARNGSFEGTEALVEEIEQAFEITESQLMEMSQVEYA